MSFGPGVIFPQFNFGHMEVSFDLLNDEILEGTEIGELSIYPNPLNFDGHEPLFKSVRIAIRDDEGKMKNIDHYTLIVEDPSL